MARSAEQLFEVFAARVAEILHERWRMDAASVLRVRREDRTLEGMIRRVQDGPPEWYAMRPTAEQLEWDGPEATAQAFVREYMAAFRAAEPSRG